MPKFQKWTITPLVTYMKFSLTHTFAICVYFSMPPLHCVYVINSEIDEKVYSGLVKLRHGAQALKPLLNLQVILAEPICETLPQNKEQDDIWVNLGLGIIIKSILSVFFGSKNLCQTPTVWDMTIDYLYIRPWVISLKLWFWEIICKVSKSKHHNHTRK